MIECVQGVVLKTEDLGESDRRLTLYTREMGKLKAKICGVKKTESKLRGLTLPFSESRFQVYLHGTQRRGLQDPGKIIGGEILDFHLPLRENWDKMVQTAAWCEILDALTYPCYPNFKEYQLLTDTLGQMRESPLPALVRIRSSLILLKILGYGLSHHAYWKNCSESERGLFARLGKWDARAVLFSEEEVSVLERISRTYLSLYLSRPLKTALFQEKMEMASEKAGAASWAKAV